MPRGLRKLQPKKMPAPRPGLDDPEHKKRVRQMRCLIAGKRVTLTRWKLLPGKQYREEVTEEYQHVCEYDGGESDPHHTTRKSQLGHDWTCVPLCRLAHREAERLGNDGFRDTWGIDLVEEAAKLAPK